MKKSALVVKDNNHEFKTSITLTLTPLRCIGDTIEYKVKCKGKPKPFANIKTILTLGVKDEGQNGIDELMKNVLNLELHDNAKRFDPYLQAHFTSNIHQSVPKLINLS